MPIRVTRTETVMVAGTSQAEGSHWLIVHHSAIVSAEAHVPEPGWRWPMPKNVAIIQEGRDLGAVEKDVMVSGATILAYNPLQSNRL